MTTIKVGWNDDRDVEGVQLQWWLGVADYDPMRRRSLLLPIPLNVTWSLAVRSYYAIVRFGHFSRKRDIDIRNAAYRDGVKDGRKMGEHQGTRDTIRSLMKVTGYDPELVVRELERRVRETQPEQWKA